MTSIYVPQPGEPEDVSMDHTPPCPECGGSGLVEETTSWAPSDTGYITTFCQCDTGEQMRVDYETEQQEWEEVRQEGREIGG